MIGSHTHTLQDALNGDLDDRYRLLNEINKIENVNDWRKNGFNHRVQAARQRVP
jgi:hypothetical protein